MGWRSDEVWLESEVLWFREPSGGPAGAFALPAPSFATLAAAFAADPPASFGLEESRRRRAAARRHRMATRTIPAVALVVGSATMLSVAGLRELVAGEATGALREDPPSLTVRLAPSGIGVADAAIRRAADRLGASASGGATGPAETGAATAEGSLQAPTIEWGRAASRGLPFSGSLVDGTQLPVEGPDWTTWNPVEDTSPNLPSRLFGHERTIRAVVSVAAAYRAAHPDAAPVVVGDISFRHGGPMNEHASHQNGLDVDVYYPRLDRAPRAASGADQVDRVLAQDLLDRFLAAGARVVFVGYSTGLRGPSGVVVPYPNHEEHLHVRFPAPG